MPTSCPLFLSLDTPTIPTACQLGCEPVRSSCRQALSQVFKMQVECRSRVHDKAEKSGRTTKAAEHVNTRQSTASLALPYNIIPYIAYEFERTASGGCISVVP